MQDEPESTFAAGWEVDNWQTSGSVNIEAEDIEQCSAVQEALDHIDNELRRDFEQTVRWFRSNNSELEDWINACIEAYKLRESEE